MSEWKLSDRIGLVILIAVIEYQPISGAIESLNTYLSQVMLDNVNIIAMI